MPGAAPAAPMALHERRPMHPLCAVPLGDPRQPKAAKVAATCEWDSLPAVPARPTSPTLIDFETTIEAPEPPACNASDAFFAQFGL